MHVWSSLDRTYVRVLECYHNTIPRKSKYETNSREILRLLVFMRSKSPLEWINGVRIMDLVFPPSPCLAADIMISDACFSDLWVIPGCGAGYKNTVVKYIHNRNSRYSQRNRQIFQFRGRIENTSPVFLSHCFHFFWIRNISLIGDSEEALKGWQKRLS